MHVEGLHSLQGETDSERRRGAPDDLDLDQFQGYRPDLFQLPDLCKIHLWTAETARVTSFWTASRFVQLHDSAIFAQGVGAKKDRESGELEERAASPRHKLFKGRF